MEVGEGLEGWKGSLGNAISALVVALKVGVVNTAVLVYEVV